MPRLLEWAKVCKSEGILLVPDWPGSMVRAVIGSYSKDNVFLLEKFRPRLVCPDWFENRTFSGRPKFNVCVYGLKF